MIFKWKNRNTNDISSSKLLEKMVNITKKFILYDLRNHEVIQNIMLLIDKEVDNFVNILKKEGYGILNNQVSPIKFSNGILHNFITNNDVPISLLVMNNNSFENLLDRIDELNYNDNCILKYLFSQPSMKELYKIYITEVFERVIYYEFTVNNIHNHSFTTS